MKLTEENILDFGFQIYAKGEYFRNYRLNNLISISFCHTGSDAFTENKFYWGDEKIIIDTVEELKVLYKLVTKKEL